MSAAPIVAYQLSLLGDPPKPGRAWRRSFWTLCLGGELYFPPSDEAVRQRQLLTPSRADEVPS